MELNLVKSSGSPKTVKAERQQSLQKTPETKTLHQPKEQSKLNITSQKPTEKLNYALPYE